MSKNTLLKGTLILTITGFLTRFIGFFYRIYLSNTLGAENLGVYQLVFPIYGICFTLYGSGLQTSISKLVAAEAVNKNSRSVNRILRLGMLFSVTTALFLSFTVFRYSDFIAIKILLEPRCVSSLKVLSYVFPFCGITACINGYYYGLKKAVVPATTQLLEQIVRVLSVYLIAGYLGKGDGLVTCELAVFGIVLGEIMSNIYNILSMTFTNKISNIRKFIKCKKKHQVNKISNFVISRNLLKLSVPLTANRLLISILNSFEAILIPSMLQKYGMTNEAALSTFGILTGMAMPFIMFPSTITNSFAVMLLPTVSEAQAQNNNYMIKKTTIISIKYSIIIGILSTCVFIIFGKPMGILIFNNSTAGEYLRVLAWLCPFLYLTTTLGSIINGLGKTHITFFNSIAGLSIQILFVIYIIPLYGIKGYLIGTLISHLTITFLDCFAIYKNVSLEINATNWILKPGLTAAFLGFLFMHSYKLFSKELTANPLLLLLIFCFLFCISYIIILFITKTISIEEFKRH